MISAKEKREQMSMEYWHGVMRKQVDVILRHTPADDKSVQLEVDVPSYVRPDICQELCDELTDLGYEVNVVLDAPDSLVPQLFIRWSK